MTSNNGIQIPEPDEHAYHMGWTSYHHGTGMSINPYDLDTEEDLYNAWVDGYSTAERVDNR